MVTGPPGAARSRSRAQPVVALVEVQQPRNRGRVHVVGVGVLQPHDAEGRVEDVDRDRAALRGHDRGAVGVQDLGGGQGLAGHDVVEQDGLDGVDAELAAALKAFFSL